MSSVNNVANNNFNIKDFNIVKEEIQNFFENKEFNKENWKKCFRQLLLEYH